MDGEDGVQQPAGLLWMGKKGQGVPTPTICISVTLWQDQGL